MLSRAAPMKRETRATIAKCATVAIAVLFAGCKRNEPPPKIADKCDTQFVTVSLISSPLINEAESGGARPVQVRLYQLVNDIRLGNAQPLAVFKDDRAALADDIVKMEETTVYPATRTDVRFERDKKARMLAAVAVFRSPRGRSWFATYEFPPTPSQGECGVPACTEGEACSTKPSGNPKFSFWVDRSRIEAGAGHTDAEGGP